MDKHVPQLDTLLTERFLCLDDEHKLAFLLKTLYPKSTNDFLEQVFGLTTGTIWEVTGVDG